MSIFSPFVVVIVGPTASGKSELAVKLAKRLNGEVISADSRQVYKGLNIGSGKVPRQTRNLKLKIKNRRRRETDGYVYRGIKHYMLDVASPRGIFTVARYQRLATKALMGILRRGKVPIVCGGTGLYVRALIDQMRIPHVRPNTYFRKKLEKFSTEELFQLLQKKDPRRAEMIDPHNPRRLVRALEIGDVLGEVPAYSTGLLPYPVIFLGIKISKKELVRRIHKRLITRLNCGLIEEVQRLHASVGVSWKRLEAFGLEYRYIAFYLQGKLSYEEMVKELEHEIIQYAKRQVTWFMKDTRIRWVRTFREALSFVKK